MPKIVAGGIQGGITGGGATGQVEHTDWVAELHKLPQANGGVKAIVTSHMTGNNEEGPEGGINNRG